MDSFYGGPPGQSFVIKQIFTSKNGATDSLKADLALGWSSLITVGDFVYVSYGLPSDPDNYNKYKQIDETAENKSYNSTLWIKHYNEDQKVNSEYSISNANGLRYDLISSMTGAVPEISATIEYSLDAGSDPEVEVLNPNNPDSPQLKFSFPKQQLIKVGDITPTGANGRVDVQLDDSDINNPALDFWLPQTQKFSKVKVVWVDAGTPDVPKVEILTSSEEEEGITELTPLLKFTFAKTPAFLANNITSKAVNANVEPSVVPNLDDPNNPKIEFQLPKAQVMGQPQSSTVGPNEEPAVTINSENINAPFLIFTLPRAAHFFYGDLIKAQEQTTTTDPSFANYEVGDYYINITNGNIYEVTSKSNSTTATFDFKACLQAPEPEVKTTPISPYTGVSGDQVNPSVNRTLDPENNTWSLDFKLPKIPKIAVNEDIMTDPAGEAIAEVQITDADTVTFDFKIPRGSRLFNGEGDPSSEGPQEAKNGDYYLDLSTGDVYLYNGSSWEQQPGSLLGPVGKALNMAAQYTLTIGQDGTGTIEDATTYIESHYEGAQKQPEDIFSITWLDNEKETAITYWQFYTKEDKWARVQISALKTDIITNEYAEEDTKAYSTTYINSLINNTQKNKDKETYSKTAIEKLLSWGTFTD